MKRSEKMEWMGKLKLFLQMGFVMVCLVNVWVPVSWAWSTEGHIMTCRIAQDLLSHDAAEAVHNLLPHYVDGDLSTLCIWPDQIRHWYKYRWTSSLHFIDTPDDACTFDYSNNLTEALLFLSHFMGDIHQPLHVGFTSDEGGNTIQLHWFRHKSNLHHVWDREIILTALKEMYGKDMDLFQEDLQANYTQGIWSDDMHSWGDCDDLFACPNKYATESIELACKWGYKDATPSETLADDYFSSRFPVVAKRIAQGGVRLAMTLNRVFGEHNQEIPRPT